MKSYTWSAIAASLTGWTVALLVYCIGWVLLGGKLTAVGILIIGYYTFATSILANIFLIQLPRYFIKKAYFRINRIAFAICFSFAALIIFELLFGRMFGSNPFEQLNLINAVTNGFAFGFAFHALWKPELI